MATKAKKGDVEAEVEETEVETVEEEAAPADIKKGKRDSVTVAWRNGTRTYSRAVHGGDFEALAKEFCDKHNAKVVA